MKRASISRPDGAQISYQVLGEGPPVTMIQGLGMPGDAWRHTASEIAERGFRAIVVDNRGTGHSTTGKRGLLTMRTMADDAAAVIAHEVDDTERSHLIGISLGGMISQHLALRHPERIHGLMLVSTTCGLPYNLMNGAFFTPGALWLLAQVCFSTKRPTLDQMQRLLAHPESTPRLTEVFLGWETMLAEQPTAPEIFLKQLVAATLHNTGARLHRIPHTTYVVTGEDDFLIPPKNADLLSLLIPNARREVVPRCGHILPQERPDVIPSLLESLHEEAISTKRQVA